MLMGGGGGLAICGGVGGWRKRWRGYDDGLVLDGELGGLTEFTRSAFVDHALQYPTPVGRRASGMWTDTEQVHPHHSPKSPT